MSDSLLTSVDISFMLASLCLLYTHPLSQSLPAVIPSFVSLANTILQPDTRKLLCSVIHLTCFSPCSSGVPCVLCGVLPWNVYWIFFSLECYVGNSTWNKFSAFLSKFYLMYINVKMGVMMLISVVIQIMICQIMWMIYDVCIVGN